VNEPKLLDVSILIGRSTHAQAVIDDLWLRASNHVTQDGRRLSGTVVYVDDGRSEVTASGAGLNVIALKVSRGGLCAQIWSALAEKGGPAGAAGRLVRDNLASRRLAKAIGQWPDIAATLCNSDIVVAADLIADRSVWRLRKRTPAHLVHGPIAMVHVLRQLAST
jgi:hypothetical protein